MTTSGLLNTRETRMYWKKSLKGPQKIVRGLVESLRDLRLERKEVTREFYPVSRTTSYTLNIQKLHSNPCIHHPLH